MNQRPTFLLISQPNSYRIAPYIKAADSMGLEVLIASRGEHSLITEVHAGIHIDLDDHDKALEKILAVAEEKPFVGVLGSDDSTVELAAKVARALDLPHNPTEAARRSRRKDLARAHLALARCPVPAHQLVDVTGDLRQQSARISYPCVIKPLNLSASRGVIRADDRSGFVSACERVQAIIQQSTEEFERTHVLVEEYIDGEEIAFEGYLHEGGLHTLAVFDKPDPLTGPFFEETIYVTPSMKSPETLRNATDVIQRACAAYGFTTGPVHAELRIDERGLAWILEIASRTIGGDCGQILDTGDGLNLESITIQLAMGMEPEDIPRSDTYRAVMMIPTEQAGILKRTEGILSARKVTYIDRIDIIIPEGSELTPLPEGNQYLGYIFASAPSSELATAAIRKAHQLLQFVITPVIHLHQTR